MYPIVFAVILLCFYVWHDVCFMCHSSLTGFLYLLKGSKMKKISTVAIVALFAPAIAQAAPIIMEGDYVLTQVSDNGTLGNASNNPGIKHDITGTGSFGIEDYLTPGTPHELFSVKSSQFGLQTNNNAGRSDISGVLTDTSAFSGYDQSTNWTGTFNDFYTISTDTFFNDGDERINMMTTITALVDLTDVEFLRSIDPDPDHKTFAEFSTVNGRGTDTIAESDFVHAQGTNTGLTIGLYSNSDITHNTGVSDSSWSIDPSYYLAGNNAGTGDFSLGLAFMLGDLATGSSSTFDYAYVMGESVDKVKVSVPAPSSFLIFALGLLGLARLRKSK